jgi:CHAT domain-containing protein
MRRLVIAALSALILLCVSVSTPQGHGLHSIRWTPLMINLLIRVGAPTATSLRPGAAPVQAFAKEIKGEGLVGLARGFMYAGAPLVVASLWKVDDRATSELMKRFYQGMLGPEALRSAGALRQAQLSIWKQKQWREPYYWAAFVLQGEWK